MSTRMKKLLFRIPKIHTFSDLKKKVSQIFLLRGFQGNWTTPCLNRGSIEVKKTVPLMEEEKNITRKCIEGDGRG